MTLHMQREIEKLKSRLLQLADLVQQSLQNAVLAVQQHNATLAAEVIDCDADIDAMEIEVEEECLKILALHQPVAIDLRFVITAMKINNDLERVGDLAANIAERAADLADMQQPPENIDFTSMADDVRKMLASSITALTTLDAALARNVCQDDDAVDAANRDNLRRIEKLIAQHVGHTGAYLRLMLISRHLERVADHATNIAEDVIYMTEGSIARHCHA